MEVMVAMQPELKLLSRRSRQVVESNDEDRRCKKKQDANIYVLVCTDLINKRFLLFVYPI